MKENFELLFLQSGCSHLQGWLLKRGSIYSDLTGKLWVFWKNRPQSRVVAYVRWTRNQGFD